jgi:hypothetical protein
VHYFDQGIAVSAWPAGRLLIGIADFDMGPMWLPQHRRDAAAPLQTGSAGTNLNHFFYSFEVVL